MGYPTELRAFLKSCGTSSQAVDPDAYSKSMRERVDAVLKTIAGLMDKLYQIQRLMLKASSTYDKVLIIFLISNLRREKHI